ncbi:hypothetical protein MKW92_024871 [Papaver armeniacum]|nr:hypothetical protein MKW92_024871 [Papaver armeniacum]
MQTAVTLAPGQTNKGGSAADMQYEAIKIKKVTDITRDQGVTFAETETPGTCIIYESVAGWYSRPELIAATTTSAKDKHAITIAEALKAGEITGRDKPKETGINATIPGGIATEAQFAASANVHMTKDEQKQNFPLFSRMQHSNYCPKIKES